MSLDHHHEQHPALVRAANLADTPAINVIANRNFFEKPEKLILNLHRDPVRGSGGLDSQAAAAAIPLFDRPLGRIKSSIGMGLAGGSSFY